MTKKYKEEDFIKIGTNFVVKNTNNKQVSLKQKEELLGNGTKNIEKTTRPKNGHNEK